jgi:L-alanine-DL-glutamate epimerase-like enolase superfamily enzyme
VRIRSVTAIPASIGYQHREVSYQVARDGVTDVVIRVEAEDGTVGWGESCSGADTASVAAAVAAMTPFVIGRSCWDSERIRRDLWHHGLWQFRESTANFAWAGIDMALWDLCGKEAGQPLYRLLGGAVRDTVNYFYYLSWDDDAGLVAQCAAGLAAGYDVFYLKVGTDIAADLGRVTLVRDQIGAGAALRIDANGAWSPAQARANLRLLSDYGIDFVEQPVSETPPDLMRRIRDLEMVTVASNEGLWTEAEAMRRILADVSDVYCFSPYWVGSLRRFQFLGELAARRGAAVCKHTHGEFAIAAAAAQHVMLTLPAIVRGNQQTSAHMEHDLAEIPISTGPDWGQPAGPGLGITVDEDLLAAAADRYRRDGQFLPYQLGELRASWAGTRP